MQTVYQTAGLLVMAEDFATEPLFVSFSAPGFPPPGRRAWEDRLFAGAKIAAIHVFTAAPDWYPPDRMRPAVLAIRAAAQGRRLVTFGQGHGGYGALKYAAALGAAAALAFSPQWSIDPADIGAFDQRFAKHFAAGGGGARIEAADLAPANLVVFDPYVPADRRHAEHIAAAATDRVARLIAPMTLGTPGRLLAEAKAGAQLAALFAAGAVPDGPALRRLLRACRADSATYQTGRLRVAARRPAASLESLKNLAAGLPAQKRDIIILESLVAARRFPLATHLLESIPEPDLREANLTKLRRQFRAAGFLKGEIHLAPMIMRAYEGSPAEYLDAVDTYVFADMTEEAGEALAAALKMPNVLGQLNRLLRYVELIKRSDVCESIFQLLIDDQSIDISRKISVGVELSGFCDRAGSRSAALTMLKKIHSLCEDRPNCLDLVAAGFENIGALSMSLVARERLVELVPDSIIRKMDVIVLESRRISSSGRTFDVISKRFDTIMQRPEETSEFWQRASKVYSYQRNFPKAIHALNKAIQLGEEEARARHDLAHLYLLNDEPDQARTEVRKAARVPSATHEVLLGLEKLSRSLGDMALVTICAEKIYEKQGFRPGWGLFYARALIDAKEYALARSVIQRHLHDEASISSLSQEKLLAFATESSRLGSDEMAAQVVQRRLEIDPENNKFLDHRDLVDQRRRLLGDGLKPTEPSPNPKRTSRFWRIVCGSKSTQ